MIGDAAQRTELVEAVFGRIHRERMADVPVLNEALRVSWLEHGPDQDAVLGVLITPWFMSLVRLPLQDTDWSTLSTGEEVLRHYPSGRYRFLVNDEPDLGHYQACSLFSPVFEFADQDAAEDTARHVLNALFESEHEASGDVDTTDLVARWYPDAPMSPATSGEAADQADVSEAAVSSRRRFLTGGLSSESTA